MYILIKKVNNTKRSEMDCKLNRKIHIRREGTTMKKWIIILSVIVLFILGVISGILIINSVFKEEKNVQISEQNNEEIYDECTDEYESMLKNNEIIEETSSESEKISPNCSITFRRYYTNCNHLIEEYSNVPTELVNKTEDDVKEKYSGWTIEEFSRNKIVLYREFDSECGEHYILKEKDGKVSVFLKKGEEEEFVEDTDIATEFLPETDRIKLQEGIEANGRSELNQLIEDYE